MTMRRRVDAWISGDADRRASSYAIKGEWVWGGRLVDQVDAERVRLQHEVLLDMSVNAEQWSAMVLEDRVPAPVTDAVWWPAAVARLRERDQPV